MISLASESSGGDDTSASICGPPVGGAPMYATGFHVIPARLRAPPQTALRTARGSRATAVSRRGAARTPIVPLTTQPPSARARSDRRERRPARVLAVMLTMEPIPSGAVSMSRTRCPVRAPGRTVTQMMFSCSVSGPTRGAKMRP